MQNTYKASTQGFIEVLDGIERKTLVFGENTLLVEFKLASGKTVPLHSHPEEQAGYLVSGHILLFFGGKQYDIKPGDAWAIPGGTSHSSQMLEDSVAVEVFSPVRKEYLP
jgi:quercetin dioxygenase-like cupin family protein